MDFIIKLRCPHQLATLAHRNRQDLDQKSCISFLLFFTCMQAIQTVLFLKRLSLKGGGDTELCVGGGGVVSGGA